VSKPKLLTEQYMQESLKTDLYELNMLRLVLNTYFPFKDRTPQLFRQHNYV